MSESISRMQQQKQEQTVSPPANKNITDGILCRVITVPAKVERRKAFPLFKFITFCVPRRAGEGAEIIIKELTESALQTNFKRVYTAGRIYGPSPLNLPRSVEQL